MRRDDYINLLHKRLSDQLDQGESAALEQWLKQDAENRQFANRVEEAWDKSHSYAPTFEPSVEQGLSKLKRRIEAAKAAEAVPVKSVGKYRRLFPRIAAAAMLAVGLFGLWQVFAPGGNTLDIALNTSAEKMSVTLSDGTTVLANANSQLHYPEQFSGNERKVRLEGEAFFDVAKDPSKAFIIQMEGASVRVLGTSFNLRTFDNEIELTVRSGKVEFSPDNGSKSWQLTKGHQLIYDKSSKEVRLEKDEQLNALAWKSGSLKFIDTRIEEIIRYMEHYYGVDIAVKNAKLQNCRFNVNYDQTPLTEALEVLSATYDLTISETSPKTYILSGGNCK